MEFTGKLGKYKIIETEDQTKTLWSEYFNEACHSLSGAYDETLYNYIQGCSIPDQINSNKDIHVFDVGFGLGIGLLAFMNEIKKHHFLSARIFSYTSIELDEDLFLWAIKENFQDLNFQKNDDFYHTQIEIFPMITLEVSIYIGDGRVTILNAQKQGRLPRFSAIFQDAFSPKKNPTLWTTEWFDTLRELSDPDVFMSTYSASVSVRKSMVKAGWKILSKKGFGQKRTMTTARLTGETDKALEAELERNSTLELHDN